MNWKRGLFRLWLFVSLLWLVGAGSLAVLESSPVKEERRTPTAAESAECETQLLLDAPDSEGSLDFSSYGTPLDTTELTPLCSKHIFESVRVWKLPEWRVIAAILAVPGLVLGLGVATGWVALGFYDSRQTQAGD